MRLHSRLLENHHLGGYFFVDPGIRNVSPGIVIAIEKQTLQLH